MGKRPLLPRCKDVLKASNDCRQLDKAVSQNLVRPFAKGTPMTNCLRVLAESRGCRHAAVHTDSMSVCAETFPAGHGLVQGRELGAQVGVSVSCMEWH